MLSEKQLKKLAIVSNTLKSMTDEDDTIKRGLLAITANLHLRDIIDEDNNEKRKSIIDIPDFVKK